MPRNQYENMSEEIRERVHLLMRNRENIPVTEVLKLLKEDGLNVTQAHLCIAMKKAPDEMVIPFEGEWTRKEVCIVKVNYNPPLPYIGDREPTIVNQKTKFHKPNKRLFTDQDSDAAVNWDNLSQRDNSKYIKKKAKLLTDEDLDVPDLPIKTKKWESKSHE